MTDNEIIKALELCVEDDTCAGCPLCLDGQCTDTIKRHALDLINRQKAEIERLKGWDRWIVSESHAPIIKKARAEAIKEFAEKLKSNMIKAELDGITYEVITDGGIDWCVNEMVGDEP